MNHPNTARMITIGRRLEKKFGNNVHLRAEYCLPNSSPSGWFEVIAYYYHRDGILDDFPSNECNAIFNSWLSGDFPKEIEVLEEM